MVSVENRPSAEDRTGFPGFVAAMLILVGALHVILSVFMLTAGWFSPLESFSVVTALEGWGNPTRFEFVDLVALYVALMNWTGWLAGGYSIWAGRMLLAGRADGHAHRALLLNLLYFPMGLTVGILGLAGRGPQSRGE